MEWLGERPFAHRGLHDADAALPENSLAAFAAAVSGGYGIELDVQLTGDGEAAVFHDDRLGERRVASLPYGQLAAVGAPTLAEALALVAGETPLLVELKTAGGAAAVAARAAEELRGYGGRFAVMSFDLAALEAVRPALPGVPLGLIAVAAVALPRGVDFLALEQSSVPDPRVAACPLLTWTVRRRGELERLRPLVDQMIFEGFAP